MQPLQLSIPTPCHEDWQQMTATEQGRFCHSCCKEVVDFSKMTDKEVLNYFFTLKEDNDCGRALPSQLERSIELPKQPVKARYWYWNYITLLFLFFNKTSSAKVTNPQTISNNQVQPKSIQPETAPAAIKQGEIKRTQTISGKIIDEHGDAIPSVHIKIRGSNQSALSDASGVYAIPADISHDIIELSAVGYQAASFSLANRPTFNFSLSKSIAGEIVIVVGGIRRKRDLDKAIIVSTPIKISGVITDQDGTPVPFATVKLKQKKQAVMTDESGKFSIKVEDIKTVLEISAVGFKSKEIITDANQQQQTITLEKHPVTLGGLMVVSTANKTTGAVRCYTNSQTIIRSKKNNQSFTDSIKAIFTPQKPALKVFPNPVQKSQSFSFSLQLKQTGNYYMQVTDATGRLMMQQPVMAISKQHNETVQTHESWSSGVYYIRLFGASDKLIGTTSFIVQ